MGWSLEPLLLGGREGWGSPLPPPRGRSRGPSLRYLRPGETGVELSAQLPPSTARPRTAEDPTRLPVSTTGQTRPPGPPARLPGPGAGAGAAPASFSHSGSPRRAAMARGDAPRDRQVGDQVGCGMWGSAAVGSAEPLPLESLKRKEDQLELHFPSAPCLGCLSLGDGGCSPLSERGGGRVLVWEAEGPPEREVLRVTFYLILTATTWSGSASLSSGWAPSCPGTSSSQPSR